ncbi:lytic transglycosylase domain-containing protein [Mucilaginibacter sp.]
MIKKHLVTCSVTVVLFIVSKLFIYSTTDVKPANRFGYTSRFTFYVESETKTLNFAQEALPYDNYKVTNKLAHSIRKRRFNIYKTAAMQRRVQRLFAVIEPILRAYGIPEDFKYIPLIESGMQKGVRSARGAAGIWQFMPGTAREYGLKVNRHRDDRLNLRKSTIAACKYIKELYGNFDNWTLAAAAYNCGSPRIAHAINHRNKGNYYLMRLNRETGVYVYNLLAVKKIIGTPDAVIPDAPAASKPGSSVGIYAWMLAQAG